MAPQCGARGRPVVLSIAGSDCSAGAGIQADLKAFTAAGCYGLTAVTAIVSEIPGRVEKIQAAAPAVVESQVKILLEAYPVAAIKTGMLFSAGIIRAVLRALQDWSGPLVVDPVMVAASGDPLLQTSAITIYKRLLLPRATLATPNLDEFALLAGRPVTSLRQMREAGLTLAEELGCAVLVKGGHLRGRVATDILIHEGRIEDFSADFVRGVSTHGTGCTYSAAIAACLARGMALRESVAWAKQYVTAAIRQSLRWGSVEALDHQALRL